MELAFQLYSARNFTPWRQVLQALAASGYTQVEGFAGVYEDPAAFSNALDETGLSMPSGHFAIEDLETDLEGVLRIAETLGIGTIYCPFLQQQDRPADAAGWIAFARRLVSVGENLSSHDLAFGWHNHDFEFSPLPDGKLPMDILLQTAPNISWEADIAWIVAGGQDPFAWIAKYADRISAIHIKDRAAEGTNRDQDGWCDVGAGTLDWAALLDAVASQTRASIYAVEHDNPADGIAFAQNSFNNIQGICRDRND